MIASRFARAVAPALLAAVALAACGGDDDATEPTADASGGSTAPLTVPPAFLPAIRPVNLPSFISRRQAISSTPSPFAQSAIQFSGDADTTTTT